MRSSPPRPTLTEFIGACIENDPLRKAERLGTQAPVGRLPLISYASVNRNTTKTTRRSFLQNAAALAAPLVITSNALGNDAKAPASERVTLGHIGVGNRGRTLLRGFQNCKAAESVAVADCYRTRRDHLAKVIKGQAYQDFREMLARDDIDAIVIATPDHWHVPVAVMAARAGKDCYVEKPLGISIEQDLICRKVFRDKQRVFQYGTQQRSMRPCWLGCELVRRGVIGQLTAIEVVAPNGSGGGSTEPASVPDDLDYDMWNGPAEPKPYSFGRCQPPGTYWVYDYSIGYLAGWGAHPLDIMVWGSDADVSGMVEIEGTGVVSESGLYNAVYNWDITGKFGSVAFKFTPGRDSTKFIGTDGWIRVWRGGVDASNKEWLTTNIAAADAQLSVSLRQDENFIEAIKTRREAVSPIGDTVRSDVISHLCNIAVRTGRKIRWDPAKEVIVDDEAAAKMMHRPMRAPWSLETV